MLRCQLGQPMPEVPEKAYVSRSPLFSALSASSNDFCALARRSATDFGVVVVGGGGGLLPVGSVPGCVSPVDGAWPTLSAVLQSATVLECVWLVGLAARALEMTVEFVKDRVQFGVPLFNLPKMKIENGRPDDGCERRN